MQSSTEADLGKGFDDQESTERWRLAFLPTNTIITTDYFFLSISTSFPSLAIYIYKTVVSDRVLTLDRLCAYPGAVLRDGSPKFAITLRWSNPWSWDRGNHFAPQREPNPASQKIQPNYKSTLNL